MLRTIQSAAIAIAASILLTACSAPAKRGPPLSPEPRPKPVALIDGRAMTLDALTVAMSELAGYEALTEHVLDLALQQRCDSEGIVINAQDIDRERTLLVDTLTDIDQQGASPRVIDSLRVLRGLGPSRFERLLRRNAMLRALVGNPGPLNPDAIQRAERQAFGERYRIRLFVSEQPKQASMLKARLNDSQADERRGIFTDACFDASIHPSSDRGGLISGLSSLSPGFPAGVLNAMQGLAPGQYSGVISTESGYALVYLEQITPAVTPSESQRRELLRRLERDTQRLAMQRTAQQLLDEHEVIVLDRSLNWSWVNRP